MRMTNVHQGRRLALLGLLALAMLAVLAIAVQPAAAFSSFKHKTATSCNDCHSTGDTNIPPVDADCTASGCHTGGFVSRSTTTARNCWTCHDPGQDMASVQTASGCANATCHASKHFGSNMAGCTSCHGTVVSGTNPDGSAHHNNVAYSAPTCTDCHDGTKAVAPSAAHAGFGSTCSTCHVGMDTTHPSAVPAPTLTLTSTPATVKYGLTATLAGSLKTGTTAISGSTVTLQSQVAGTTAWVDGGTATTAADGSFSFPAVSPTAITTYRVIAPGAVVNTTVVRPGLKTLVVKVAPVITIKTSATSILLGKKIIASGTVTPTDRLPAMLLQRYVSGKWVKLTAPVAKAGTVAGAYTWTYKPLKKGTYRVQASLKATTQLALAKTAFKTFKVK
jgi:hypothetical protein